MTKKQKNGCLFSIDEKTRNEKLEMRKQKKTEKKKKFFSLSPMSNNFKFPKPKAQDILTATPSPSKQNSHTQSFPQFIKEQLLEI